MKFQLVDPLSSTIAKVGDDVPLRLARPLIIDGVRLLEPGIVAHGTVTRVRRAGPNCQYGKVEWKVDAVTFGDSSTAKTYKVLEVARRDWEPPETYPSQAIGRGRHSAWKGVFILPVEVAWSPIMLAGMWDEGGDKCTTQGKDYVLPANSVIAVAIAKDHRVRY